MRNPRFLKVIFEPENGRLEGVEYILSVANLLNDYSSCLFDDFFGFEASNSVEKVVELVRQTAPAFWVVLEPKTGEFAGFAYLYDWVGTPKTPYSACIATCFRRKYWGAFAYRAGRQFLRYLFAKYPLSKLNAQIYKQNRLALGLLNRLGFVMQFVSPRHTLVGGVPTDLVNFERLRDVNKA